MIPAPEYPDESTYRVEFTEAGTMLYCLQCGDALVESNVLPGWAVFYCMCGRSYV